MGVWSTTTPNGSDLVSQGDDKIREMKTAIQEALRAGEVAGDNIEGVEAIFPGATPSTAPVYRYRGLKGTTAERPTAGQYGLYYDTTRNVLQRDNGTSWDDIAQNVIPSGTAMVFYQASAPVGWTKSTTNNDKALRVVSGSGGASGGTGNLSDFSSHVHATSSHTLLLSEIPSHSHNLLSDGSGTPQTYIIEATPFAGPLGANNALVTELSGGGGGHDHGNTGSPSQSFSYIDVIVCTKD